MVVQFSAIVFRSENFLENYFRQKVRVKQFKLDLSFEIPQRKTLECRCSQMPSSKPSWTPKIHHALTRLLMVLWSMHVENDFGALTRLHRDNHTATLVTAVSPQI